MRIAETLILLPEFEIFSVRPTSVQEPRTPAWEKKKGHR
jgi:hypothetical protein